MSVVRSLLLSVCLSVFTVAGRAEEIDYGTRFGEALSAFRSMEYTGGREDEARVAALVNQALPGSGDEELAAASLAVFVADPTVTLAARQSAARLLAPIAGRDEVPVLTPLLLDGDPRVTQLARTVLEPMPVREAGEALLTALPQAERDTRIGIINSLGVRAESAAVTALAACARERDLEVACAAVEALGAVADRAAARALAELLPASAGGLRDSVISASVRCAEGLRRDGRRRDARRLYDALRTLSDSDVARAAGLRGAVLTRWWNGLGLATEAFAGDDPDQVQVAAALLRSMPGARVTRAVARLVPEVDPERAVLAMRILVDRRDHRGLGAVKAAAGSDDVSVQRAALDALAKMGDDSCVELVATVAAGSRGAVRDAARDSLARMPGEDVDEEILDLLSGRGLRSDEADGGVLRELIRAVEQRRLAGAGPVLLKSLEHADSSVREAAYAALEGLGTPERDLEGMLRALVQEQTGKVRDRGITACAVIAKRIEREDRRAALALELCAKSEDDVERATLVEVLGRIGRPECVGALVEAGQSQSDGLRLAAVRAMSGFPTQEPLTPLLEIAASATDTTERVLALRGAVGLLALPPELNDHELLAACRQCLAVSRTPDDLKLVMAGLARVPHPGVLDLIREQFGNAAVADEARLAGVQAARAVWPYAPAEAEALVREVQAAAGDSEFLAAQAAEALALFERLQGYVAIWKVSGPYTDPNSANDIHAMAAVEFPPETRGAPADWRVLSVNMSGDKAEVVDLDRHLGGDQRTAFLRVCVIAPEAMPARLHTGSDDGIRIWLNGVRVFEKLEPRGYSAGQDITDVDLREGMNALMLEILEIGGNWEGACRLTDRAGNPIPGVRYSLDGAEDTSLFVAE